MHNPSLPAGRAVTALVSVLLLLAAPAALAVPSFARQTGMACEACHTVWPELNHFGRVFKANGYLLDNLQQVRGVTAKREEILSLASLPPLSIMVQISDTQFSKGLPDADGTVNGRAQNGTVGFPQQISLFYAGKIAPHGGAFVQLTYSNSSGSLGIDNTDIRFADLKVLPGDQSLIYGVSLNNNPTVQDLWNSIPAWGFPWLTSGLAPVPAAGPLIGSLGQTVAGASAYAMIENRVYVELGGYKGLSDRWLNNVGLYPSNSPHIAGVAPYVRATLQFAPPGDHYYSVGVFGLDAKIEPDPAVPAKDRYTDIGVDATYQYTPTGKHSLAVNASAIREKRKLDSSFALGASDASSSSLRTLKFDASYTYDQTWGGALAGFDTRGDTNAAFFSGSANGSPNSQGYIVQAEYIPFGKIKSFGRPYLNVRVGLQYIGYTKFDGGTSNYDGSGRNASDNNTLFAFFWVII